jgi:hypothetical protein
MFRVRAILVIAVSLGDISMNSRAFFLRSLAATTALSGCGGAGTIAGVTTGPNARQIQGPSTTSATRSVEAQADRQLQLACIMAPWNQSYWWYYGQTGQEVGQLLTQNNAMLTSINAYVDTDGAVKFAVVMEPANQRWWWWYGQTAQQVGQLLTQNNAMLTNISAYIDTDGTLKFVVVMVPATQAWWWYYGSPAFIGQQLTQNNARMIAVSPYLWSSTDSISVPPTLR